MIFYKLSTLIRILYIISFSSYRKICNGGKEMKIPSNKHNLYYIPRIITVSEIKTRISFQVLNLKFSWFLVEKPSGRY